MPEKNEEEEKENDGDEILPFQFKPEKTKNYKERMKEKGIFFSLRTKKKLNPVSKNRKEKIKEYQSSAPLNGKECCSVCGRKDKLEKHHPYGRGGDNITKWIYLCGSFGCKQHSYIHENPRKAFIDGWLQPEYRGLDPSLFPNHPKPWEK